MASDEGVQGRFESLRVVGVGVDGLDVPSSIADLDHGRADRGLVLFRPCNRGLCAGLSTQRWIQRSLLGVLVACRQPYQLAGQIGSRSPAPM